MTIIGLSGDSVTVERKDIVKHEEADLMLLKLSKTMSGAVSLPADDDCKPEVLQKMAESTSPSFVLVGRDTNSGGM